MTPIAGGNRGRGRVEMGDKADEDEGGDGLAEVRG